LLVPLMRAVLGVLLALCATAAYADIYTCPGVDGMTVYQNFPCEFSSLGSVPVGAPTESRLQSAALPAANTRARAERSANANVDRGKRTTPTPTPGAGQPQPGMSEDEVRKLWGEPEEIIQDEPPSGRVDIWRYKDGRTLRIDHGHRVAAVQF
jgi:hypothetical protein